MSTVIQAKIRHIVDRIDLGMAKSIKCPTCATAIEVTPSAVGQVVKCPGCGRGIKLVAKPKSAPPSGAGGAIGFQSHRPGPTAQVSNPGESQRSYVGEPAIYDEPPRLDTTCEICGKYTDEADLVEDQGRMVCRECALAAAAGRSGEPGPDLAPPPYVPSRRGNLINFTPVTFIFIFFALVWAAAYFLPRFGVGQQPALISLATNKPTKRGSTVPASRAPRSDFTSTQPAAATTSTQPDPDQAHADAQAAAEEKTRADAEWEKINRDEVMMRFDKANRAFADQNKQEADRLYREAFDFIKDRELNDSTVSSTVVTAGKLWKSLQAAPDVPPTPGTTSQPVAVAPDAGGLTAPPDPVQLAIPATPVGQALLALKQKDYVTAARLFEELRREMASHGALPQSLSTEQQLILIGKAAADLGRGKPAEGRAAIDLVYLRGNRTRAVVLNRAMVYLAANQGMIKELVEISESVRNQITDELTADIYGTLLNKLSALSINEPTRADLARRQKELDEITEQRFAAAHPGQLKWGIDWLPADNVKQYRLLKGSVQDTALIQLNRQLAVAKDRAAAAQKQFDAAISRGVTNTTSLKTALDAANAQVEAGQQKVNDATQAVQPQRWLEQFEPVAPEEQP